MKQIWLFALLLNVFLPIGLFAQSGTKYQSQIKPAETLWKIEYFDLGTSSSGPWDSRVSFNLRKWNNLANGVKKYDLHLTNSNGVSFIEKGDWNYVYNCLQLIKTELGDNSDSGAVEYTFRTSNGIIFTTSARDKEYMFISFPNSPSTIKISVSTIEDWLNALSKAKELAH